MPGSGGLRQTHTHLRGLHRGEEVGGQDDDYGWGEAWMTALMEIRACDKPAAKETDIHLTPPGFDVEALFILNDKAWRGGGRTGILRLEAALLVILNDKV